MPEETVAFSSSAVSAVSNDDSLERTFFKPVLKNQHNMTVSLSGMHILMPFNRKVYDGSIRSIMGNKWRIADPDEFRLTCWWASVPGMIGQGNLCGPETELFMDEMGINIILGPGLLCGNCELKGGEDGIMFVLESVNQHPIDRKGFQYYQPTCSGNFSKKAAAKLKVKKAPKHQPSVTEPIMLPPKSVLFPDTPELSLRSNSAPMDADALLASMDVDSTCSPASQLTVDELSIDDTLRTEIHVTGRLSNKGNETMDLTGMVITVPFDRKVKTFIGMKGIWQQESPKAFLLECWEALVYDAAGTPVHDLCGKLNLQMVHEGVILSFGDASLCASCYVSGGADGVIFSIRNQDGLELSSSAMTIGTPVRGYPAPCTELPLPSINKLFNSSFQVPDVTSQSGDCDNPLVSMIMREGIAVLTNEQKAMGVNNSYAIEITIKNNMIATPIDGWRIQFSFPTGYLVSKVLGAYIPAGHGVASQIVLEHADVTKKILPGRKKFVKLILFSVSSKPYFPSSSVINGVTCNSVAKSKKVELVCGCGMKETTAFADYEIPTAKQSLPFASDDVFTSDDLGVPVSPTCPQFELLQAKVDVSTSFKQIFSVKVTVQYSGEGHRKLKGLLVPVYFSLLISKFTDESIWQLADPSDFVVSCRFGNVIGPIADSQKCDAVDIQMSKEGIFVHFLDGILCGGCNLLGTEANVLFDFRHADWAILDPSIPEGDLICTDSTTPTGEAPVDNRATFFKILPVMQDGSALVVLNSTAPISGLQFSLVDRLGDHVAIDRVGDELKEEHAFTVDFDGNTLLAFSMTGSHLPVLENVVFTLFLDEGLAGQQVCFTHAVVADDNGAQVPAVYDPCEPSSQAPILSVTGKIMATHNRYTKCDSYVEKGATAFDDVDGDLTSQIITTGETTTGEAWNFDTTVSPGKYVVKYAVSDSDGNISTKVRNILIEATEGPCGSAQAQDCPLVLDNTFMGVADEDDGGWPYALLIAPVILNVREDTVQLNGAEVHFLFNTTVELEDGSAAVASWDDFEVSCWEVSVDGGEDLCDVAHVMMEPGMSAEMAVVVLKLPDVAICEGCAISGGEEGVMLQIQHKSWLSLEGGIHSAMISGLSGCDDNSEVITSDGLEIPTISSEQCESSVVIQFDKENSWSDGYSANAWIQNFMEEDIDGWTLSWQFQGDVVLEKVFRGVGEVGTSQVNLVNTATTRTISPGDKNHVKFTTETITSADAPILVDTVAFDGALCEPGDMPLTFVCKCSGFTGAPPPVGNVPPVYDDNVLSDEVCKSPLELLNASLQSAREDDGTVISITGVFSHAASGEYDMGHVHIGMEHSGIALVGSTLETLPIDEFELSCQNLFVELGGNLLSGNMCQLADIVSTPAGLGVTFQSFVLCEGCLLTGGAGAMFTYSHKDGLEIDSTFSILPPTCAWNETCVCDCVDNGLLWQDKGYTTSLQEGGWLSEFGCIRHDSFGIKEPEDNISIELNPFATAGEDDRVLHVVYPEGSWSPNATRHAGIPVGGAQFKGDLGLAPQEALRLSYWVRLDPKFDCVLGGKLPGLYGGVGNTGANLPTGADGFSTRLMWRDARCDPNDPLPGSCNSCNGEIYAFLPFPDIGVGNPCNANITDNSGDAYACNCREQLVFDHQADLCKNFSISLGRGSYKLQKGIWHHIEQETKLNTVLNDGTPLYDGWISVSLDGELKHNATDLLFRLTDELKIDGILFATFFGGGTQEWATPGETFSMYKDFKVYLPDYATFLPPPPPVTLPWSDDSFVSPLMSYDFLDQFGCLKDAFGLHSPSGNIELVDDTTQTFPKVIQVTYPAGSWSPEETRKAGIPIGGAQFEGELGGLTPQDTAKLSYSVRFADNFDCVKGGKLPGLYGGKGNSDSDIPDGTDGFSSRFQWRDEECTEDGCECKGELYLYIPQDYGNPCNGGIEAEGDESCNCTPVTLSSINGEYNAIKCSPYGTSLHRGSFTMAPGRWYYLEQELALNSVDESGEPVKDGRATVWVDGKKIFEDNTLVFRTDPNLRIDGIMFSTYFGGDEPDWATPVETYTYYANFTLDSSDPIPPSNEHTLLSPMQCDCSMCQEQDTGGICSGVTTMAFTIDSVWSTGYSANITISNQMDTPVDGWIVSFKLGSGEKLNKLFRGELLKADEAAGEYTIMSTFSSGPIPVGGMNYLRITTQHESTNSVPPPANGYGQLIDLTFRALEWPDPLACKDVSAFGSATDAVSELLFDCLCSEDEVPVEVSPCDESVDISMVIVPASDHDGVVLGVPTIVNTGPTPVSLAGLTIPIEFNGRVMSPEGAWYTASPDEFLLSCWNGYVKLGEEIINPENVCSDLTLSYDESGFILMTFHGPELCPGCSISGNHQYTSVAEGTLLVLLHQSWNMLDYENMAVGAPVCTDLPTSTPDTCDETVLHAVAVHEPLDSQSEAINVQLGAFNEGPALPINSIMLFLPFDKVVADSDGQVFVAADNDFVFQCAQLLVGNDNTNLW
eukprot:scaffold4720_cov382-Prasinococcus_capsulatus_cf.AAC.3